MRRATCVSVLLIVMSVVAAVLLTAGSVAAQSSLRLKLGNGSHWAFRGGDPWVEDEEGVIHSFLYDPAKGAGWAGQGRFYRQAFCTAKTFAEATIEFDFFADCRQNGAGSAGLILRAQDAANYYLIDFPWGGQAMRSKNFWAGIAKVTPDGYIRHIKFDLVPGVPSETDRWYKVRVEANGPNIKVWVDGRKAVEVTDESFASGFIGLAGHGYQAFRNIRVTGKALGAPKWDDSVQAKHPAVELPTYTVPDGPNNTQTAFDSQIQPSLVVAPNGDLLLAAGYTLLRSTDKGRTWQAPETLPSKLAGITDGLNTMLRTKKGRLLVQHFRHNVPRSPPGMGILESTDNGKTWSDLAESTVSAQGWPAESKLNPYGPLVETADGTLLRFLYYRVKTDDNYEVFTWGANHCKGCVIRSTDGGKSWSGPIELDRPTTFRRTRGEITGALDFTEGTGVAVGNVVTCLIRPIYSPQMWQCWSYDGGATWDAASRTTFPGYAQSMVRTKSGAIVCAHRFPQYSINVSYDNGLNWDAGTIIDTPSWAMGCITEVEPNVVLCLYMNEPQDLPLRAQRIRVTPRGLVPAE